MFDEVCFGAFGGLHHRQTTRLTHVGYHELAPAAIDLGAADQDVQ
jgi:hypothetical protein